VACPFFRPLRKLDWSTGRAPLGAMFEGECANGGTGNTKLCNFGYARGLCAAFPDAEAPDAVRFSVAGNAKGVVRVVWVLEKAHAPVEHGILEYRESTGEFIEKARGVLGEQAQAFVSNYLSR
jgi:hypothetical protein